MGVSVKEMRGIVFDSCLIWKYLFFVSIRYDGQG